MKKLLLICFVLVTIQACTDTNDDIDNTNLAGTAWVGTGDDEGEIYTFVTDKDYKWVGEGTTEVGTYTFDGKNGTFNNGFETYSFEIDGLKLIVEGDIHIRI